MWKRFIINFKCRCIGAVHTCIYNINWYTCRCMCLKVFLPSHLAKTACAAFMRRKPGLSLGVCIFSYSSVLRYTPNPGGGVTMLASPLCGSRASSSAAAASSASPQGRATPCSVCSNTRLPVLHEKCPFHHLPTEGCVKWICFSVVCTVLIVSPKA